MITLYTTNVDRFRGYEWNRGVWLDVGGVNIYGTTGFSLRLPIKLRGVKNKFTIEPSWFRQHLLGIRITYREVTLDQHFKPELPINSLMLEICDEFLNKTKVN